MKLDTNINYRSIIFTFSVLVALNCNSSANPQNEVIKFNEKQESKIQRINSNFLGYHIRYRKGNSGEAVIFYTVPPRGGDNDDSENEFQGAVVIVDANGEIIDVRPFKKRGSLPGQPPQPQK